jgi:hypothetical protein
MFMTYLCLQESSLEAAIRQQTDNGVQLQRTQPFILRFSNTLFVIADSTPIMIKPATIPVALDVLLKSYYVLNVSYPRQASVLYDFMQHTVLDLKGKLSAKAMKLHSELM